MIRRFVIGGRQVGKTREILERMLDGEDLLYVAPTVQRAQRAYEEALRIRDETEGHPFTTERDRKAFRERFMSWEQAADPRMLGRTRRPVVVENADEILQAIFGQVDTVTMRPPLNLTIRNHEGNPEDD